MSTNSKYRNKIREYTEYGIIYKGVCNINGKIYIGQTIRSLKERISEHYHKNSFYINNAIRKYGIENFSFSIIERCYNQEELDIKENYWIEKLNTLDRKFGYNLKTGGEHGTYSEEVRRKMSENMKGSKNHRYGKTLSEETKLKMKYSHKKRIKNYDNIEKKVICNETQQVFKSVIEVAKLLGIPNRTVGRLLKNKKISAKFKLSFKYL